MTVRVRLQRLGRRNKPFYRVVVADSRSPRDGKFIELVGTYNPLATKSGVKEVTFKVERIRYWISVGAQPSDRVAWLLGQFGILPPKVVPVARTKQTIPRKEWKELKKQQAKGFHTSAACSAVAQPSLFGLGGGCSEALHDSLPRYVFGVGGDAARADQTAAGWQQQQQHQQLQHRLVSSGPLGSALQLVETGRLAFGWGTGQEVAGQANGYHKDSRSGSAPLSIPTPASGASREELASGIAAGMAQVSLSGTDGAQQGGWPAFAPLRDVLASHLSLLGPSACSTIGLGNSEERRDPAVHSGGRS